MMRYNLLSLVVGIGLAISSCGFTPVYKNTRSGGPVGQALAGIEIAPAPDRTAQLVRNELLLLMKWRNGQEASHLLEMSFQEQQIDLAIQLDDSVTRRNLILRTTYTLKTMRDRKVSFNGEGRAFAAYNRVPSEYANLVAERDARERAAKDLAYQIRTRLAAHFASEKN